MNWKQLQTPLDDSALETMRAGERYLISGVLYTARDRAHRRIADIVETGGPLPFDMKGALIYYAGPSPAPPGKAAGSAGPTTSTRMDPFTETMLRLGVKGFIGKGKRGTSVRSLLGEYRAVYFATYGGAGAYLSTRIVAAEPVAFLDLGPEAVYRYEVREFPVIVVNDIYNGDMYESVLRRK